MKPRSYDTAVNMLSSDAACAGQLLQFVITHAMGTPYGMIYHYKKYINSVALFIYLRLLAKDGWFGGQGWNLLEAVFSPRCEGAFAAHPVSMSADMSV